MKQNNELTFLLTNDDRPLREQTLKGSILEDQYLYSLRQINEFFVELKHENILKRDNDEDDRSKYIGSETIHSDTDYNNNIFAFIGDRGSGKTSCMISVADFLIKKSKDINWDDYSRLKDINFDTIDLIDPTYFDSTHNLISLFLAKLYKNFLKRTEENENKTRSSYDIREFSEIARNKFLAKFQTTQEHLYHLLGYIKYTDGKDLLEYVDALAASVNLKEDIGDLVDIYQEYMDQKDTVLILRIDDVDINEKHAGEMVETMRKYFIQPNILVLVSFKLKQLEDIKYLELKQFYERDEVNFTYDDLHEMVDKYMVKLIPHSHRIFMPQAKDYHGKRLKVQFSEVKRGTKDESPQEPLPFASVRQAVPQLIFWKTRYLFYNSNSRESYIVPSNLRELRQLVKLLVTLPDYRIYGENDEGKEIVKKTNWNNKDIFKNYFFETWVNNNLPAGLKEKAIRVINEGSDNRMNTLVYDILENVYPQYAPNPKTIIFSPSFADILSRIHLIENRLTTHGDLSFLFFIKSLYSIRLYEAYDIMTEDEHHGSYRNEDEIFIDDDSRHAQLTPYQMLVGKAMFFFGEIVVNGSYDFNEDKYVALIANCITRFKALPMAKKDIKKKLYELELRVKWVELIMLCVNVFKKDSFDVGVIFCHLPYVFDDKIGNYGYVENGDTFFKTILRAKNRDYKTLEDEFRLSTIQHRLNGDANAFTIKRWQSFCTIRNVEVLEGFLSTIKSGNYSYFNRYDDLKTFFVMASSFKVNSYDRDENGREPYCIHFKFFEKVLDLISETDKPTNAVLKRDIISILGDMSQPVTQIGDNENPSSTNSTTPAV